MAFLSIVSIMLIGSCQSSPEALSRRKRQAQGNIEPVTFKTVVKSETVPLSPDPGYEGSRMLIIMSIQNIPSRGKLGDLIRNTIFNGIDPEEYGEKIIAGYRSQYQEEGKQSLAEGGVPSESWNWEYSETVEGTEITPERAISGINRCFVIYKSREYYLGGAHGMREKRYFLFDTVKGKRIGLDELIQKNVRMTLRRLIAAKLRVHAGLEENAPLSQGGFFTDLPEIPDNFFLTSNGLGFHWDPYEIAPYVMGSVEIIIPYDELMDVLR
ncbi:MAG: RsiV family protein [Treponema sp.]|nr:RsiV family protein [Treponema sp.]